jgi:epoxide hydrolase
MPIKPSVVVRHETATPRHAVKRAATPAADSHKVRSFHVKVTDRQLDDLRDRLARTRWPVDMPDVGWTRGVPVNYLKNLTHYWRTGYDWRAQETELNAFPQFTTQIDGQTIHFLHVRSPEPDALPLIVTHGWPGSVVEFMDVIGPLTNPRAHGGDPADAFHVVAPSIPGCGFSGPTHEVGWNTDRVALAWAELMSRLGYDRYGAQGGDTGAIISPKLARIDSEHVVGVHANGLMAFPSGAPGELDGLSVTEQARMKLFERWGKEFGGYAILQSTRPQTLAYALTDSPVGQLAWIVERFKDWTDPAAELPEDAVDRDRLLTNVMVYWLTGTACSSAQLYFEDAASWGHGAEPSGVPTGVAVSPMDISIRRLAEREHTITHWTEFDRGGHFAAMETPDLLVEDIRAFFRTVRPALT